MAADKIRRLIGEADLHHSLKVVLFAFAECAAPDGTSAFPRLQWVADFVGMKRSTLMRKMEEARRVGLIEIQYPSNAVITTRDGKRYRRRPTTYRFNVAALRSMRRASVIAYGSGEGPADEHGDLVAASRGSQTGTVDGSQGGTVASMHGSRGDDGMGPRVGHQRSQIGTSILKEPLPKESISLDSIPRARETSAPNSGTDDKTAGSADASPMAEGPASEESISASGATGSVEPEAETPHAWLVRQAARRFGDDVARNRFAPLAVEVVGPELIRLHTSTRFESERLKSLYLSWLCSVLRRPVEIIVRVSPAGSDG